MKNSFPNKQRIIQTASNVFQTIHVMIQDSKC